MSTMAKRGHQSEVHRRQKAKNVAMLLALLGFVVVIYLVSVVRMAAEWQ